MQNYFQQNGLTTVFVGRMVNVRQGILLKLLCIAQLDGWIYRGGKGTCLRRTHLWCYSLFLFVPGSVLTYLGSDLVGSV